MVGTDLGRFLRPLTVAAFAVLLATGCAGQVPTAEPTDEPLPTDTPTLEPVDTSQVEPTTPGLPTDAGGLLDLGAGLPTTVTAILGPGIYVNEFPDGSFSSTGTSRICGSTFDKPGGFVFEFPEAPAGSIDDVTFGADDLVPGTSTGAFKVNVGIENNLNLTSLDTKNGASGTAMLSVDAQGARKLVVDATGEGGVSVHLEATCGPAGG